MNLKLWLNCGIDYLYCKNSLIITIPGKKRISDSTLIKMKNGKLNGRCNESRIKNFFKQYKVRHA